MAPKKPDDTKKYGSPAATADFSLISDERKEAIRKKAEEKVKLEKVEAAEKLYELQMLSLARGETTKVHDAWLEEDEEVTISLPRLYENDHIAIDNRWYTNGFTYNVPRARAMVLREICEKAWAHEDIAIRGRNENIYRKKRNVTVSGKTLNVVNTATSLQ